MASAIRLENLHVNFEERFDLLDINWTLEPEQHWVITGTNGSGKSALAAILAGFGEIQSGSVEGLPARVGLVSFEVQKELIAKELKKDDADIMDVISEGTPVREMIFDYVADRALAEELVVKFGLSHLMDRAFRKLSTGETRKMMLIRELANQPDLLVLDEPFDGLDADTLSMLQAHLASIIETTPMVMVLNRFDEMPEFITHIAYTEKRPGDAGTLSFTVDRSDDAAYADLYQLLHLKTTPAGT